MKEICDHLKSIEGLIIVLIGIILLWFTTSSLRKP
jgi:hypothetical protein